MKASELRMLIEKISEQAEELGALKTDRHLAHNEISVLKMKNKHYENKITEQQALIAAQAKWRDPK